jgi:hypothetical protein
VKSDKRLSSRRLLLAIFACTTLLAFSTVKAQTLLLLDSNQKAHIQTVGSIPIQYKNTGTLPLHIWGLTIQQSGTHFTFDNTAHFDSVLAPGATGYFTIYFQTVIAYEYSCTILFASNDPLHPIQAQQIRVNDTVPPNPVRNLQVFPLKAGQTRFSWSPPSPARDGDSVWKYEVYTERFDESQYDLVATTLDTFVVANPPGDGQVYIIVLTWDNGGNTAKFLDTAWTSRTPPAIAIVNVDPNSNNIPEHVSLNSVPLRILAKHNHFSEVKVFVKDTAANATPQLIGDTWGPLYNQDNIYPLTWNSGPTTGIKDIVVYARDSVGNDTTAIWRFRISQETGWPRFMAHRTPQPGSTTITADETGPFLSTGSDIADAAFRFDGTVFYNQWPLNVTRPSEDFIVTSTGSVLPNQFGLEMLVGNTNNNALLVASDGHTITTLGQLPENSEVLSMHFNSLGVPALLAGPSPVVIEDQSGTHIAGAEMIWNVNGDSLPCNPVLGIQGQFEFDRVVAGSLNRDGNQYFVRVHSSDVGTGEVIGVYDAKGNIQSGWPRTLWYPSQTYHGFYPSLGDIDGDGKLEIVIPAPNDSLYIFRADGSTEPGYPIHMNTHDAGHNQALLVDVNGDGAADIIIPAQDSIQCIDGLQHRPMLGNWPIYRHTKGSTLLTAVDLNNDGSIDLIESPQESDTGGWCYIYKLDAKDKSGAIQWGTFQHDMRRSGNYDEGAVSMGVSQTQNTPGIAATILPQPARDRVTIVLDPAISSMWSSVAIYDMLGRERLAQQNSTFTNPSLDLRTLPVGTYAVRITTPSKQYNLKLVKCE